jgi:hypothetical protein
MGNSTDYTDVYGYNHTSPRVSIIHPIMGIIFFVTMVLSGIVWGAVVHDNIILIAISLGVVLLVTSIFYEYVQYFLYNKSGIVFSYRRK